MATTTHIAAPAFATSPLALWHLLSLDAPTVAALWTWFIARSAGIHLPAVSPIAMALAVWVVYASDRLLDASRANRTNDRSEVEARHHFHDRHRRPFSIGIAVASVTLGALLPFLDLAALRLYLLEGALLAGWFVLLHATLSAHRLPKEIAVGAFFSAAVFIPTVARNPVLRQQLAPAATLLAVLCALNCLFIYAWEHEGTASLLLSDILRTRSPHSSTQFALRHIIVLTIAMFTSASALAMFFHGAVRFIAIASALSALLLLLLHRNRARLSHVHVRAAADLALLTPLLLLSLTPRL